MNLKDITKKYENQDITIIWKPKKCIHAAECVKRLPEVYNPDEKPWIKPENGNKEELIEQINACPSGALSFDLKNQVINSDIEVVKTTKIDVTKNGPILVHGEIELKLGEKQENLTNKITAFCRCGSSKNKPYCDGSHKSANFEG